LADAQLESQHLVFELMDIERAVNDDLRSWNQFDFLSSMSKNLKRADNEDCSD
jgi:hypothetical protein